MSVDTKTALLNSAERAVRSRGFDGFSYADLAADIGIRKASIHHHFPTKAALSVALMQRYSRVFEETRAEIDAAYPTGGARLAALIDRYEAALDGGKSLCLCVAFSISRESLAPEVICQIGGFRAMMIAWLEGVFLAAQSDGSINACRDARAEAAAVLSLLEGAQLAARAAENAALFERATRLMRLRIT